MRSETLDDISYKGARHRSVQCLALGPVLPLGATINGSVLLGINRVGHGGEFSFILAVPMMVAARSTGSLQTGISSPRNFPHVRGGLYPPSWCRDRRKTFLALIRHASTSSRSPSARFVVAFAVYLVFVA